MPDVPSPGRRFLLTPTIYRAERDGVFIIGTAGMIAKGIRHEVGTVRKWAREGRTFADGWRVVIALEPTPLRREIYVAEHPDDDPIIGDAEEVAALLGIAEGTVHKLCAEHRVSRHGWTVRRATEEEIRKDAENGT